MMPAITWSPLKSIDFIYSIWHFNVVVLKRLIGTITLHKIFDIIAAGN